MGLFDILSSVVPGVGRTVRDVENVTDAASSTSSAGSAVGSAAAGIVGSAVSIKSLTPAPPFGRGWGCRP